MTSVGDSALEQARTFGRGSAGRSADDLLEFLAREAAVVMRAERASIFLLDRAAGELWSRVAVGIEDRVIRLPIGRGIVGHVVATGELCNVSEPYADPRFNPAVDRATGYRTRSILCAPLRAESGATLGALQVLNKAGRQPFSVDDERLVWVIAQRCAAAIEHTQRVAMGQSSRLVAEAPRVGAPKLLLAQEGQPSACSLVDLFAADFQVVRSACHEEALSIVERERPDLFLLDVGSHPERAETCRALRATMAGREIPIIVVSASRRPEDTALAFDAGASDYIVRPYNPSQLRAKAHTWLLRTSRRPA